MESGNESSEQTLPPVKKTKTSSEGTPSRKGKTVVRGAARHITKFNKAWSKKYECIQAVSNNPHVFLCTRIITPMDFLCTICNKSVSCKHQGEADVTRHITCAAHNALDKQLETQQRLTFHSSSSSIATKVSQVVSINKVINIMTLCPLFHIDQTS